MSWSQAEVLALATKAARGAGAPAGQAQRFGQAVVAHLVREGSPEDLLNALYALPGGAIIETPLSIDALLAEASSEVMTIAPDPTNPLFESYVLSLPYAIEPCESDGLLVFRVSCAAPRPTTETARLHLNDKLVAKLRRFADATLVPESEASRSSGAGAGLDDND